ncbi:MAG: tetratricopeptide repeat protein [Actinobacteria bacterium]|nr:MAG: tetratricopeptide repeat protein [Actinomycetota bacterium]
MSENDTRAPEGAPAPDASEAQGLAEPSEPSPEVLRRRRFNRLLRRAVMASVVLTLVGVTFVVWSVTSGPRRTDAPANQVEWKIVELREVVAKNPKSARAHANLGVALLVNEQEDEARKEFNAALKIKKDDAVAITGLAEIDWRHGNHDKAIKSLTALSVRQPKNPDVWLQLGVWLQAEEQWQKAADAYEEVLKINAFDSSTLYRLGVCFEKLGKRELAIAKYQQSIRYVPDYEYSCAALERLGVKPAAAASGSAEATGGGK